MLHSMTGFARSETEENGLVVHVEIRSYNSKNLDISLRMSSGWLVLEEQVKRKISETVDRGRIEVNLQVADRSEKAFAYDIDHAKALAYRDMLFSLKETFDLSGEISLEMLAGAPGIIRPADSTRDTEADWGILCACLERALADLGAMRRKEGAHLEKDLGDRLSGIASALVEIKTAAADLPIRYQQRLSERIAALTQGQVALDGARIAQEAAMLADRSDISEEVVRADSHLLQFRHIMDTEAAAGRKLNFLLQELNREFTTMGAKAGNAPIAHLIVQVKSELEKMREQVQNVE